MTARNHLADQTSPYLLQHADNPVDWYPWGPEALEKARREDKPILLSVGYSACHWCHVMAHESFEDEATAALMNELFVNIKVDREERPDLDKIYQLAHAALTRRGGGWPLTVFLSPDQVPFFGGTYFPKEPRHGMPAFADILRKVDEYFRTHRDEISRQNASLLEFFRTLEQDDGGEAAPAGELLDNAARELEAHFDAGHGGFGEAPKFPQATALELCLRLAGANGDRRLAHIAGHSLRRMAEGGVYDQLGGGFFRYSVDAAWTIPHFEKMLYDNGQLLELYARAWQIGREAQFERIVRETAAWLLEEMRDPEGGFYAALDADSEGGEGGYYTWTPAETGALLEPPARDLFNAVYGLDREANFEGRWHLKRYRVLEEAAEALNLPAADAVEQLRQACVRLLEHRRRRERPLRDEKILTAWNALAAKGLLTAGMLLDEPGWIEAGDNALALIEKTAWDGRRLLAVRCRGESAFNAYLDDYAFLLDALLQSLQARWDSGRLAFARKLAGVLLEEFQDPEAGGFFFTARNHEALIHRPRPLADESTPAGAMIAARALAQLGHLAGDAACLDAADRAVKSAATAVARAPLGHAGALIALLEQIRPPAQIVLCGDAAATGEWKAHALAAAPAWTAVYAVDADASDLPEALAEKRPRDGCTAYICRGVQCSAPVTGFDAYTAEIERLSSR